MTNENNSTDKFPPKNSAEKRLLLFPYWIYSGTLTKDKFERDELEREWVVEERNNDRLR